MFSSIKHYFKEISITLRFSILSVFAGLFVITMVMLVIIYYSQIQRTVMNAALLLMNKTSYSVLYELDAQLRPAQSASQLSANNIRERVLNISNQAEISSYMVHLLNRIPLAIGVYWADANGDFVYTYRLPAGGFVTEIINRHAEPPTDILIYLDNRHEELRRETRAVTFDPRNRIWFTESAKAKHTIWTEVYIYREDQLGITVATPAFSDEDELIGVFGVDISLDYLTKILGKQKVGMRSEIFIFDNNGTIVASSSPLKKPADLPPSALLNINKVIDKDWLKTAFSIYNTTHHTPFHFEEGGKDYLASFIPIPILKDNGWVVAIIDIASDFTRQIHRIQVINILILLFIFALGLALMSHVVTLIVKPIKKLVLETEKIKNFDLDERDRVNSKIKEVTGLANSIYSMKHGLRSFQKYVPASLVRQLIKTGEDARIGGYKQKLVMFFSDIQDFTRITEKEESNKLVKQTCDYFEALSHIIIQSKGTIDKYIGDSIMAFWGAPVPVPNPCHQAARAALRCMQFSQILNMDWAAKNKPLFITHIGLHFGETIVGSLGSSERLNYTALGDTVNLTSRLVNANKLYGTFILVTDSIYQEIKDDFVLRLVDRVMLKGKVESVFIYELLGADKQSILFDIAAYKKQFSIAFATYQEGKWEEAIKLFIECLRIYPDDTLAPVFIERCRQFIRKQPKDWDGIWYISEK